MGVPTFDVGAQGLMWRNFDVEMSVAFVKLAPLHVEVSDQDIQTAYFRVEIIRYKEAFKAASQGLVEAIETDCRADLIN